MATQSYGGPTRKVTAATLAATGATLLMLIWNGLPDVPFKFDAQIQTNVVLLVTGLVGYFVPPSTKDTVS